MNTYISGLVRVKKKKTKQDKELRSDRAAGLDSQGRSLRWEASTKE